MWGRVKRLIESLENRDAPFFFWVTAVGAIIMLRNLFESVFESQILGLSPDVYESIVRYFIHYPLNYLSGICSLAVILFLFTGERIEKIAKAVVSFSWVILLCPLIDALWLRGQTYPLGYYLSLREIGQAILYSFHPGYTFMTVSYGLRIEALVIVVMTFFYIFVKTRTVTRALGGMLSVYLMLIIILGGLPVILLALGNIPWPVGISRMPLLYGVGIRSSVFKTTDSMFAIVYMVYLTAILIFGYAMYHKEKCVRFIQNIRPFRALHYCLIAFSGAGYGYTLLYPYFHGNRINILIIPALWLGILGIWKSAVVFNDICDHPGDMMTNNNRPLPQGVFKTDEYRGLGLFCLIIGSGFLFCISYFAFLLGLTFWLAYFIYSCPPLRVKKIFPCNMIIIVFNGIVLFLAGLSIFTGSSSYDYLNGPILLSLTLPYLLAVHVITLKDIESDRKERVNTLAVLAGKEKAKNIMAILSFIAFPSVGFLLHIYVLMIPGIVFGTIAALLVLRRKWDEKLFFANYLVYFFIVTGVYWIKMR